MAENLNPISMKEGSVYLDSVKVMGSVKLNIKYTPEVWEGRALGERGKNRRWTGRDITGTITEYKSTNWLRTKIDEYEKEGKTPEFTIQGTRDDKNSDFYSTVKTESVTIKGVIFTGDLVLMDMDAEGDVVKQEINFGAKTLV